MMYLEGFRTALVKERTGSSFMVRDIEKIVEYA